MLKVKIFSHTGFADDVSEMITVKIDQWLEKEKPVVVDYHTETRPFDNLPGTGTRWVVITTQVKYTNKE